MHEIILCKLGEVVLKGLNRRSFEMKLMSNIRRRTQRFGKWKIYSRQSTIYVEPAEETCDIAGAYAACKQVFGIIAITRALPCEKSKEAIFDTAKTYLGGALNAVKSFKVESKRADKSFPMGSIQLSQWVGGALHDAFPHLKVDVHHPELTVYIEVREDAAYVHGPAESRRGRSAPGHGRPRGEPAVRRYRQSRGQLHDRQARRTAGDDPLRLSALHRRAGAGEGAAAWRRS